MKLAACQRFDPSSVPEGWTVEPIKNRLLLEYGSGLTDDERQNGAHPVFGSNGQVGTHESYLVEAPGVLVGRKGSVGEVHFSETPFWPIDTVYYVRRLGEDNWRFLYYLLGYLNLSRLNAATGVPGLTRRDAHFILGAFPEKCEQDEIARVLRLADDAIAATEGKLTAARQLKTALMQQLFTRGIPGRHSRFKEAKSGEIPQEWEVIRLKRCGQWGSGGTPDRDNKAYWNGNIPWVKSGEVDYRPIVDSEEKITPDGAASVNGALLSPGTLLVAMYGAGVTRGKAALLSIPAYVNQAIAFFQGNADTDNHWLLYWLEHNYQRVRAFAGGSNQDNLSLYLLKNIEIARPRKEEQKEITDILQSASKLSEHIRDEITALQRLKRSLFQNLLTGKVRVKPLDVSS